LDPRAILARAEICQGLEPDALSMLSMKLRPAWFPRKCTIFHEDDPGDFMYILISGRVKLSRSLPRDRTSMLAVMGPSDIFGELSVIDPGVRTSTATTLTDVRTMSIDREALLAWMSQQPAIAENLLSFMTRRVRRTNDLLMHLLCSDAQGRVARRLLQLAEQFGAEEDGILCLPQELTQGELGQLAGTSRETVNRVITDLMQRGWIRVETNRVLILEPERLA
jgi:CRP-like cAMP-binding protein